VLLEEITGWNIPSGFLTLKTAGGRERVFDLSRVSTDPRPRLQQGRSAIEIWYERPETRPSSKPTWPSAPVCSTLLINAMDATPEGGTILTGCPRRRGGRPPPVSIQVFDRVRAACRLATDSSVREHEGDGSAGLSI